jgi:uncharacterized protein
MRQNELNGTGIIDSRSRNRYFLEAVGFALDRFSKLFGINRLGSWTIEITNIEISIPGLAREFDGFQLVQISDFHFGSWLGRDFLEQAIDRVNNLAPDMVVITGDFVSFFPEKYSEDLVSCLKGLKSKEQTLAVLGNHDHWSDADEVRRVLSRCQIKELNNHVHCLKRGFARLYIAGVDDQLCKLDRLDIVTGLIPLNSVAILLAHEPDFADVSGVTGRFNLQLSGHTHGGQIKIPLISKFFLPSKGRKYPSGLYNIEDMYLYTNRGLGTTWLNIRYNCPPEITLIKLKSTT